jgi:hypothetical protein
MPYGKSSSFSDAMDSLSAFGLFAVVAMLICYALEHRSRWFILAFAVASVMGSAYGFLQGAWLFGLAEAAWSIVALRRWRQTEPSGKQVTISKIG